MQTELQSEGDFAAAEGEDSVVEEAAVTGTLPCRALGLMHAYKGSERLLVTVSNRVYCYMISSLHSHTLFTLHITQDWDGPRKC